MADRKHFLRPALCAGLAFLMSATAALSAAAQDSSYNDDIPVQEARLFGDFLKGEYADEIADAKASAQYLSRAYALDPENTELGVMAIRSALESGDYLLARTIATEVNAKDESNVTARVVLAARDMGDDRYRKASKFLKPAGLSTADEVLLEMLRGWNLYGQGKSKEAIEQFSSIKSGVYFDYLSQIQIAIIHAKRGEHERALVLINEVEAAGIAPVMTVMAKAGIYSENGDDDQALEILEKFSSDRGNIDTGPVDFAIKRLKSGKSMKLDQSAAEYASAMAVEPVGFYFAPNNGFDVGQFYLNIALILDPQNDYAKVWLGNLMEREGRDFDAEQTYRSIDETSEWAVFAGLSLSNLLFRDEQNDAALDVLKDLEKRYDADSLLSALALGYLIREEFDQALPLYQRISGAMSEEELKQNPEPLYFVAVSLHELDRWEEAEPIFLRVIELKPDYSEALNYLGYSWVDRGENLNRGFEMIRKAVELEPESGAIIDSLGWAHYKLGEYDEALIHLEDAAAKEPGSATIIDHLGDVYWKLGRFREAGYQWERALTLEPTEEERANIEQKLQVGLTAETEVK